MPTRCLSSIIFLDYCNLGYAPDFIVKPYGCEAETLFLDYWEQSLGFSPPKSLIKKNSVSQDGLLLDLFL